ncbi:FAD/NAD(P)-binding domain-containing protein [Cadophora sp. DSE1049]|nr:FAD/NAD(P)-binding domain-containing protein [Cadophora sp. DSE1049]
MAENTTATSTYPLADGAPELANGAAPSPHKIIVVGAGPVGLFLTFLLAKRGFQVDLIECIEGISKDHRAAGYYGGVVHALKDAGILHMAAKRGWVAQGLGWRALPVDDGKGGKKFGRTIGEIPFTHGSEEHPELGMLLFPQAELCKLLEEQILALGENRVRFHFNSEICGIKQPSDGDTVTATIRDTRTGETRELTGDLLAGADGGKSATRNLLGISLQGHTWPERVLALNVITTVDNPSTILAHHVVDPIWYATLIPLERPVIGQPSLWRFCMAVDPTDNSPEEVILSDEYLHKMLERHMVGPRPLQYELKAKSAYVIHQRLTNKMSVGRCVIIGDAAHLNNPMGALGLSTGLLDAEALVDTIQMIFNENKPISTLETFSHERRKVFQLFVEPTSKANKLRLQQSPEAADEDWMVRALQNPTPESMKEFFEPYMKIWRSDMRAVVAKAEAHASKAGK